MGFNGDGDEKLPLILHETVEEGKGSKLAFRGFRSPPLVDEEDAKVGPLHVIFDLKGVLVGKEYLKIN